jgi:hypothetical protein
MKSKIKIIIVPIFCLLGMTSCFEDFLEEEIYDFLPTYKFFKTETDAIAGVNGIYNTLITGETLSSFERASLMIGEYPSESSTCNGLGDPYRTEFERYSWSPTTAGIEIVWKNFYKTINRSNRLIVSLPNITGSADVLKRVEGEAKFLRALAYFYLIRLHDHIPLVVDPDDSDFYLTNADTDDAVWNQIIEDLQFAETNLPPSYTGSNVGRATSGAAKAILAKVYLSLGGYPWNKTEYYTQAAEKCEEIIESGIYTLEPNFANVFKEAYEHGSEYIFSAEFQSGIIASSWPMLAGIRNIAIDKRFTGWGALTGTSEFYLNVIKNNNDNVEPNIEDESTIIDKRLPTLFVLSYTDVDNGKTMIWGKDYDEKKETPHTYKHTDLAETGVGGSNLNIPLIRYADVLLMHSEAVNNAAGFSGKYDKLYGINTVRNRAGLEGLSVGLSKGDFNDALIWERVVEFCFEGQIWYDYKRMEQIEKRAINKKKLEIPDKKYYVFPIPQNELNRNPNLVQHPAWK